MSRVDLKVVLLGKEFGGKTSLVERYLHDRFTGSVPYQSTIGAAFGAKRLEVGDRCITMGIWDTAGSERFESMSRIYYRGAKAAIVCFDPTDRTSFDRAKFWITELKKQEENCRVYICATKKDIVDNDDLLRQVEHSAALKYASGIDSSLFETSSKTGENISDLFYTVAVDYVSDNPSNIIENSDGFELNNSDDKLSCCGSLTQR